MAHTIKGLPNLKAARAVTKLSQSHLAQEIGITRAAISRMEKGLNDPSLQVGFAIVRALAERGLAISLEHLADYKGRMAQQGNKT